MLINIDLYTVVIPILVTIAIAVTLFYVTSKDLRNIMASTVSRRISEYTTLKCPTCGYVKVREFRPGDYVGKVEEEKCPNDGSNLVIMGISKEASINQ
ncbi:hypothetical protein [Caldivirga sp. UBA161]|uniref:hypothetical protein n=1 Tax=Caldivirga sp. UBA161 TaxID=1915569 RepID=UPI0025BE5B0A|nr:hypothetical protein [Caldivirga sp. UBA161]